MEAFCILNSALDQIFCFKGVKITNMDMCAEFQSYSTKLSLFFAGISEKMKKNMIFFIGNILYPIPGQRPPQPLYFRKICVLICKRNSVK